MITNVNLSAPIGVLLFLATALILVVLISTLIFSQLRRKTDLTKFSFAALFLVAAGYFGLMLVFSLASSERVLARGQEKHFCEIDCHLAYSIVESKTTKVLGPPLNQISANGLFRVVTIKTRFDENTISATRGSSPLYPNSRVLVIVDAAGREYFPAAEANRLLASWDQAGSPFTTPLRPGESYLTTVVFDLPADISNPTLLIHEGEPETRYVIGHENSLLHKKTRFQI
ncbi:MAG TPA: hypothetical protein VJT50_11520 [Pyrinomonadaceae bacterium]|nr:hypothetical protein [Pyrinomonadaceae bacterium]